MPFVWQAGGDVLDGDRVVLDTPEATEAFGFYKSFFDEGLAPTSVRTDFQIAPAFVRGTHPMFFSGPWQMRKIRELAGADFDRKWTVAPVPARRTNLSFVGGGNWTVLRGSGHRAAAWDVRALDESAAHAGAMVCALEPPTRQPSSVAAARVGRRAAHRGLSRAARARARSPSPTRKWERVAHAMETGLDSLLRGRVFRRGRRQTLSATVAAVAGE